MCLSDGFIIMAYQVATQELLDFPELQAIISQILELS